MRVPTEVIKTRRQVGAMGGVGLRSVVASSGVAGLFVGYGSFLLRDLPFDAIEFAGYESLKKAWGEMKGEDGATFYAGRTEEGKFVAAVARGEKTWEGYKPWTPSEDALFAQARYTGFTHCLIAHYMSHCACRESSSMELA